ncbi:MAG: M56 family metallopeptidase [Blautia sp.]|nr:M56 family metallopeptidase [Blautia sp.]
MSLVRVSLLYMSVCGGILILTVFCLRMLLRNRLPKATFSILWCVALLRLLSPFSLDAPFGILPVIQDRTEALQERFTAGQGYGTADGKASGYDGEIGGNVRYGSAVGMEKVPAGSPVKGGGLAENGLYQGFWKLSLLRKFIVTGDIVCAAVFFLLYLNCLRRFRTALPVENPFVEQWLDGCRLRRKVKVMQSDRIHSPLTYGLVRPVILLPKHLEREDGRKLGYILQHEMVHIRRFDGAWKLAMAAALCLHWFNPLVWMMYVLMNRDLELSCDEEVLRVLGAGARKDYALTLIGMEERRQLPVPLYSGFGKNAVEERIGEIMKYKKKTKAAVGAAAALVLAVICVFATTARAKEDPSGTDQDLSEESAVMLMDPPAGYSGDVDSSDGSGTVAGTDSNGDVRMAGGTKRSDADIAELARRLKEVEEADTVTQLVRDFMKTAGEKDRDSILPYIAEGYEVDLDCLDRIMAWEQGDMHVSVYVKGDLGNAIVSMRVTTDESEEDSNDHLTLGLIKGGDGWRICFMVFEK